MLVIPDLVLPANRFLSSLSQLLTDISTLNFTKLCKGRGKRESETNSQPEDKTTTFQDLFYFLRVHAL